MLSSLRHALGPSTTWVPPSCRRCYLPKLLPDFCLNFCRAPE